MNATYINAPATKLLATHCAICGRPLVDADSVERGIGPDCRGEMPGENTVVNKLIHAAALAAQCGKVEEARKIADQIAAEGYVEVASKIRKRFEDKHFEIFIEEKDGYLYVKTPLRRGKAFEDMVATWRCIPGRRFEGGKNVVPVAAEKDVFGILRHYYPGLWGKGRKGDFRVPTS